VFQLIKRHLLYAFIMLMGIVIGLIVLAATGSWQTGLLVGAIIFIIGAGLFIRNVLKGINKIGKSFQDMGKMFKDPPPPGW
jgi:hypothetical protein